MTTPSKRASLVILGLPWNDSRVPALQSGMTPEQLRAGLEAIDVLLNEHGFVRHRTIQ